MTSNVIKVLMHSCSEATQSQYFSVYEKWVRFCEKNYKNPMDSNLNNVLEFLTNVFENNLSYSSVNTARSCLSLVLNTVDGFTVGNHPLVVRLLKGVARLRPPMPRYQTTWDTNTLLKMFDKWPKNENLSLSQLSYKLVSLLLLSTGQRVQTIHSIKIDNIILSSRVEILIPDRLKTSGLGRPQPTLILPYNELKSICVASTLETYLYRTAEMRKSQSLFVSLCKPHRAVSKQTLSRWLVLVLKEAGINVNKYKSHSFRHCSVSKAFVKGIDIDTIYKCAGWSNSSRTFARFYNRPFDNSEGYSNAVLSL